MQSLILLQGREHNSVGTACVHWQTSWIHMTEKTSQLSDVVVQMLLNHIVMHSYKKYNFLLFNLSSSDK